ncbi:neutral alpha-glucosidase C [Denticeps clupeoides]|uniref:Glycoside hydrolase family 31 N-terminal domain-containing protein n=1 Tax=Denticeps clupeoides TaxID=299321 RepID=A0AAY4C5E6_9TELE|nr:neutral alpha-glucosidase C-like [Denticeps clupeoides]XP_028848480.1 neutral alpha-glucosidase C-like [Denticeps clupeoides]
MNQQMAEDKEETTSVVPENEDKQKYKTSEHIAFYRRHKLRQAVKYCALLDSLVLTQKGACMELFEPKSKLRLLLQVNAIKNGSMRLMIDEVHPIKERYQVPDVLIGEPVHEHFRVAEKGMDSVTITWGIGLYQVRIYECPFKLELLCKDEVTVTFNPDGRLFFEPLQEPPRPGSALNQDHTGLWQETFGQFVDIKANGPSSVGLDIRLHEFSNVYGIPEHADNLRLKDTSGGEPYRLYNLDVFAYDIDSRLGLYGSIPLLLAHKCNSTIGLFWLNASETLVDVQYTPNENEGDEGPPVKRSRKVHHTDLHWISESGMIDCFVLLGPSPSQTFSQFAQLTGYQALPPLFSLGYHQCRWNYEDEADVKSVDAGFDLHNIPYDVIWLDIEHTDGKRYFTWDPKRFPSPVGLQKHIAEKKRKLVVISDPHIKVDPSWPFYCEAKDGGHFVRDRNGTVYTGTCWPGESSYLDFSCPHTRSWYARWYSFDMYKGSTESLFVWNDMNEPSVFSGPEQTIPKDTIHHGGWEHRELHNLYGFYQHMATVEGLMTRSGGTERPFVLSRSFFAGSQRLGAVWTGDNVATLEYLKISIPMLLSLSVAGIAFCGADVGGFVKDPEPELLVRWYQAGAFQPFFRGHSDKSTKRREPWLFGDAVTTAIRSAIEQRYCLLPYWYTLFYLAHTFAQPPIRPLWVEFPEEERTFAVDSQYMIGSALLVCPVTAAGIKEITISFPGSNELWYDVHTALVYRGYSDQTFPVTLDTVPLFQRGGTVVPRRTGCGSCTADLQQFPINLTVALDHKGCAEGLSYQDDGHSFDYRDIKKFSFRRFLMKPGGLACRSADEDGSFSSECLVQFVVILGMRKKPSEVTVHTSGFQIPVNFQYEEAFNKLTIGDLDLSMEGDWDIRIQ